MLVKTFLFLAATSVVSGVALDGKATRIVGGVEVEPNKIPWQVSVQTLDAVHRCGGVLISKRTILTAATCTEYPNGLNPANPNLQVMINSVKLPNDGGSIVTVADFVQHPDFKVDFNGIPHNDISILHILDPPLQIGIARMLLQGVETPDDLPCFVSGWGTQELGGAISATLQQASVLAMSQTECAAAYSDITTLPENQMCAGQPLGGADACQYDEGGPLFSDFIVHGLVSWGEGCGEPNRPGVYTQVSAYRNWIDLNTIQ